MDVNFDNIVFSKSVKTRTDSKCLIGTKFAIAIRSLVLIMPKMNGYIRTFKVKERDKDKSNKLMSFHTDDEKLLQKYKAIWIKVEDLRK